MVARIVGMLACLLALSACAVVQTPPIFKIALLAPFEGTYRDIGYNALYAARLALRDNANVMLLAVDDGGTPDQAARHAAALAHDPAIIGVLLIGPFATTMQAQNNLGALQAIIVGDWSALPQSANIVQLSAANMLSFRTQANDDLISDERLDMESALRVADQPLVFLSPGTLPDETYQATYRAESEFAPPPNTLATLVSDATDLLVESYTTAIPVADLEVTLRNGVISFQDGSWSDAPVNRYRWNIDGRYEVTRLN